MDVQPLVGEIVSNTPFLLVFIYGLWLGLRLRVSYPKTSKLLLSGFGILVATTATWIVLITIGDSQLPPVLGTVPSSVEPIGIALIALQATYAVGIVLVVCSAMTERPSLSTPLNHGPTDE